MRTRRQSLRCLGVLAVLAFAGCSFGPVDLRSDRTTYNIAVQKSANEQILLNLVRLKYREPTSFIEIGSISANFNYYLGANLSNLQPYLGSQTGYFSGSAYRAENPTITYSPLQGEQFAKRLMSEMDIKTFILLLCAGWNPSRLMRLTVERIGDLDNDPTQKPQASETDTDYTRFVKFTKLLTELQLKGVLHFGLEPGKGGKIAETMQQKEPLKPAEIIAALKDGYELVPRKEGGVEIVKSGPPSLVIEAEKLSDAERAELSEYLKFTREHQPEHVAESQSAIFYLGEEPTAERIEVPSAAPKLPRDTVLPGAGNRSAGGAY